MMYWDTIDVKFTQSVRNIQYHINQYYLIVSAKTSSVLYATHISQCSWD